jgi:hypothetical protein
MVAVRTNLNQRGFLKPSKHSSWISKWL